MTQCRTFAVMGGTGMQGGAAIAQILLHQSVSHPLHIRILTRRVDCPEARALVNRGVTVIKASQDIGIDDNKEKDNEIRATFDQFLKGVDCVFALTFTQYDCPTKEERIGRILFQAIAESSTVKRVVFSGGERTGISLLDAKASIEQEARRILSGKKEIQCVFLHTSFFMENILIKGSHKRFRQMSDGTYELSLPLPFDRSIAMISARDIGHCAACLLLQPDFIPDGPFAVFPIVGDIVSPETFLQAMGKMLPEYGFCYRQTTYSQLQQAMGDAQANLVHQMDQSYYQKNSDPNLTQKQIHVTRQIYPDTKDIQTWIQAFAKDILLSSRCTL